MKYSTKRIIEVRDWDNLVKETYNKPYSFQQQEGCMDRGTFTIIIPCEETYDDEYNDSIPEVINGEEMGVKFAVWLARDPQKNLNSGREDQWGIDLWWERNFYPDIHTLANDLHSKGLIEAGEYVINIDW